MNRSLALAAVFLLPLASHAKSAWKLESEASVSAAYDTNAFNLSESQQDRVDDESAVDKATGRIRDMKSVDDFVTTISGDARWTHRETGISVAPHFAYQRFVLNGEKSFPEFGIALRKDFDESALKFDFNYELDSFKKNYVVGTTVGVGSVVLPSERIYQRGIYDEWEIKGSYQHTLWRTPRGSFLRKLEGEISAGYGRRTFGDAFANRDLDRWDLGVELGLRVGESTRLELSYGYADVGAPGENEIVILDETAVGVDLNADFDANDLDVSALTAVDRSRKDHSPRVKAKFDLGKRSDAWLAYGYTKFDYRSDEALDVGHRGRSDHEHAAGAGARWGLSKHWAATLAVEYSKRDSSKTGSLLGDEDGTKSGALVFAGVSWGY